MIDCYALHDAVAKHCELLYDAALLTTHALGTVKEGDVKVVLYVQNGSGLWGLLTSQLTSTMTPSGLVSD